jgi:hypothetical protein
MIDIVKRLSRRGLRDSMIVFDGDHRDHHLIAEATRQSTLRPASANGADASKRLTFPHRNAVRDKSAGTDSGRIAYCQ